MFKALNWNFIMFYILVKRYNVYLNFKTKFNSLFGYQVSRLVILHEEAEDGNAMPDLARPVQAVSLAVNNLVKVWG